MPSPIMSEPPSQSLLENPTWSELKLPELLMSDTIQSLHAIIDSEWDSLQRSACQMAAGRALWKHVVHDPLADILAGESYLRSLHEKISKDRLNNAREVSGVILAVRTLWFDSKIEAAVRCFDGGEPQLVMLGAGQFHSISTLHAMHSPGMDTRAYRLCCLKECSVFEVDFPKLLQIKAALLQAAEESGEQQQPTMMAKSLTRVAADVRDNDWFEKLQISGFVPARRTIWVLEGLLYYLSHIHAMQVLKSIATNCAFTHTILLADFMNKSSTTLSESTFHFYSDWPEHLLPSLGFSHVQVSQLGDPDANFGLMHDPQNIFNKLRELPRSVQTHPEDGTPCRRLYLVQTSGSPDQTNS